MKIIFSRHALIQMAARGAEEDEVILAIEKGNHEPARENKFKSRMTFPFNNISPVNNKFYNLKTIDTIFVEGNNEIIVVTVKVYYHNN